MHRNNGVSSNLDFFPLFKAPRPIKPWQGELQATKKSEACLQYTHKPGWLKDVELVEGSEDCLYMNIYVPDREGDASLLPVFFWIHGGAFTHGTANGFGAKYLVDRDVIVVAVNYRLGPLGMHPYRLIFKRRRIITESNASFAFNVQIHPRILEHRGRCRAR